MSYADGWAAMNLEMPPRVPRTEYAAGLHWDLMTAVTGIDVGVDSDAALQRQAQTAFYRAWNYDFLWVTLITGDVFGNVRTSMGHAEFMAGGVDMNRDVRCPFASPEQVLAFDPGAVFGERDQAAIVRDFERSYAFYCELNPDSVNMTGIYITCMSGLIDLFGWDMLLYAAGTDLAAFGEMANRYCAWIAQYFEALAAARVPVVMVHDDIVWTSGPFLAPDWYRQYVFPNYKKMLAPLYDSGKRVLYTSDGDYTMFIDDLVACGLHGFIMEPLTDMALFAERYGRTHVFVGNADTRILLTGTKDDIRAEVERCMAIGKGCPGFFMAVGNHIPPNTPVDAALYYNECYEKLSRR